MTKKVPLEKWKNNSGVDSRLDENIVETNKAFISFVIIKLVRRSLVDKTRWKSIDENHY